MKAKTIAHYREDWVRFALQWKAVVFKDERDAARHDEETDDLKIDRVVDIFSGDLDRRGIPYIKPDDPVGDPAWIEVITRTYGTLQNLMA